MGLLIDGIIGPILETFGVIEIGSDGEWTRIEKKPKENYQKKERNDKESLWDRFIKWFQNIVSQIKSEIRKNRTPEERYRSAVRKDPEELNKTISEVVKDLIKENEGRRTRNISKEKLRKISKFEGKALASTEDYKLWYGDHFPYDDEVEEGVVYVVKGQGDAIAYTGPLAGIRQDAYYVWDKTKETTIDRHTGEINIGHNGVTKDYYMGTGFFDTSKNYVIYPNTVDDFDDGDTHWYH